MNREVIERQAKLLAADNYEVEPDIERVYWFPDETEVRLVELMPSIPEADDGEVHPFFFPPSLRDELPAWTSVAMIRPAEFGRLALPKKWGRWEDAVLLEKADAAPAKDAVAP